MYLVDLALDSGEYNFVLNLSQTTAALSRFCLLYSQWKRNILGLPKERRLLHGTSADVVDSINHHSFYQGYAGMAVGAMYGRGCM